MKRWHTREDSGIRLDAQLRWWHDDEPVEHEKVIEAFNRGMRVTDDGRYKLEIGADWCFVQVADAAFGITAIDHTDDGAISVRLTDRTAERLDASTLTTDAEGILYARVKEGRARARFSRDAQFALGSLIESTDQGPKLRVNGELVPLPASLGETPV